LQRRKWLVQIKNKFMKSLYATLLFLIFVFESSATSVLVSGNVSGTWTADTILIDGNLTVQPGELLSISAGTVIQFQSYYRIDVLGSISAVGFEGDTIIFTIRDTSNFYAQEQGRGGWSGIRFRQLPASEDSSLFSYCRFEFSKATEDSTNRYGGAIFAHNFGKLRISNCMFFHNYSFYSGGAVYLNEADALIENCVFRNNYSGNTGTVYGYGGGICSINSAPVVVKNEFYGNSSTGVGGASSFDNSDPVFENNIMQYNFSALGGALGVLRSSPTGTFSNNLVTNNNALFFGGGICCIQSFPVFSNLTVANNDAAYGGGFYCNDSAAPTMYNSIIWGNTGFGISVYIWDIWSAPSFHYCDIEGDSTGFEGSGAHLGYHGQYLNNLNENPRFFGSGIFPYQLLTGSPCTDAGIPNAGFLNLPATDLAGAARIENNRIDMGAYEYNGTMGIKRFLKEINALKIYPDPFINSATIALPERSKESTEMIILDIQGQCVKHLLLSRGETSVIWNGLDDAGKALPGGLYVIFAKNVEKVFTGKIIK
jgi:hypothetical protein